jgi:Fur family ferric uptake transcriptional regulator
MADGTEQLLAAADIRSTANRLLVLRQLEHLDEALSLHDLERRLPSMERSSIFRVLQTLNSHGLLHEIDDGTGAVKYELCREHSHTHHGPHDDQHIHFTCERCRHTFCMADTPIPPAALPEGFVWHSANYVIHGLCPLCAERQNKKIR